jgi:hypothetical protein
MMTRFKIRDLIVNVALEEGGNCEGGQSLLASGGAGSNCGNPSCVGPCQGEITTPPPPPTQCEKPSCKGPGERKTQGWNELAGSNLALLQQELRTALSLYR